MMKQDIAVDYPRLDYRWRSQQERFARYVERTGLTCSDCHGEGKVVVDRIDYYAIYESCGWCRGTGKMTRHDRGVWLNLKKQEKQCIGGKTNV